MLSVGTSLKFCRLQSVNLHRTVHVFFLSNFSHNPADNETRWQCDDSRGYSWEDA